MRVDVINSLRKSESNDRGNLFILILSFISQKVMMGEIYSWSIDLSINH